MTSSELEKKWLSMTFSSNFTFRKEKKKSVCSNYSPADLWLFSCQFFKVIWCFLEHLAQDGSAWWSHSPNGPVELLTQQLRKVSEAVLNSGCLFFRYCWHLSEVCNGPLSGCRMKLAPDQALSAGFGIASRNLVFPSSRSHFATFKSAPDHQSAPIVLDRWR